MSVNEVSGVSSTKIPKIQKFVLYAWVYCLTYTTRKLVYIYIYFFLKQTFTYIVFFTDFVVPDIPKTFELKNFVFVDKIVVLGLVKDFMNLNGIWSLANTDTLHAYI